MHVSFGLFVRLAGTEVPGIVLAPAFIDVPDYQQRVNRYPLTSMVRLEVVGAAEGRRQIDLKIGTRAT